MPQKERKKRPKAAGGEGPGGKICKKNTHKLRERVSGCEREAVKSTGKKEELMSRGERSREGSGPDAVNISKGGFRKRGSQDSLKKKQSQRSARRLEGERGDYPKEGGRKS